MCKVDTLNLSRALMRSKVKNHKLVTLSKYFKTVNQNEHNSKADVLTTYEVFKNLAVLIIIVARTRYRHLRVKHFSENGNKIIRGSNLLS